MFQKKLITSVIFAASTLLTISPSASAGSISKADKSALTEAVNSRSDETKARDKSRHPIETISFFKIKPGMTVAEALPGGGWYSNILANYLGDEGTLIGLNYNDDMWPRFGFFSEESIKGRIAATKKFPEMVQGFTDANIKSDGFTFDTVPASLDKKVDRVLFIRALHNLNRFDKEANTLVDALAATHKMLKDDGYVGVVQHQIPESAAEKRADGSRGYLKLSTVKEAFAKAGFELVASSDINANAKDKPSDSDIVWRLPPSYSGSRDDAEKRKALDAIGESNRMTLLFKKASM